jgi:small conductance mechanosensitive channel
MQILGEQVLAIAREYPHEVISSPELLGVDSLKESSVVLRAKIKTKPGRQYAIERDLNQRVLKYFLEGQILLPAGK